MPSKTSKPSKAQVMSLSVEELQAIIDAKKEADREALQQDINATTGKLLDLIKRHESTGSRPKIPAALVSRFANGSTPSVAPKFRDYSLTPRSALAIAILTAVRDSPATTDQITKSVEGFAESSTQNELARLRKHDYITRADHKPRGGKYKLSDKGRQELSRVST